MAVAFGSVVVACATGPSDGSVSGKYALVTIDDHTLPFAVIDQCGGGVCVSLEIVAAEITLEGERTASVWTDSRYMSGTVTTSDHSTGSGIYSIDGQTISFSLHGSSQGEEWSLNSSGTLVDGTISLRSDDGFLFRYKKR